jgi:hypothetical protein
VAKSAVLALKIVGDASSANRALGDAEAHTSRFGGAMGKLGALAAAGAAAGVAALVGLGKAAFDAASDLQQSTGAVESVFKGQADVIKAQAEDAQNAMGLSINQYQELASVLGSQLSNAGYSGDQLSDSIYNLTGLGADLAAQFGGSTADAVDALSSVLKGETDPIERYGVSIKQSDINARLAAQGQDKLTGAALKNATAQAALALIMDQTKSANGAFAREADTAAGAQARLSAWWENAKATLGEKLLPVFVAIVGFVTTNLVPIFDQLVGKGGALSGMFAQVGSFITGSVLPTVKDLAKTLGPLLLPILKDVGRFITATVLPAFKGIYSLVQTYVVPIFKTVLTPVLNGIHRVFGIINQKISENSGTFQRLFQAVRPVFEFLRDKVAPFVGGVLGAAFNVLGTAIGLVVDAISWVVDKISWLLEKGGDLLEWVGGLFGATATAPAPAAGPAAAGLFSAAPGMVAASLFSAAGGSTGPGSSGRGSFAGGDVYTITVNGALDPAAVADQIAGLLDKRARRLGVRVAGAL